MFEGKDRRNYGDQSEDDRRHQAEIEHLIAKEEDPKARLQLMILNKINLALIANTNVTNSIRQDLDQHLEIFATRTKEQDALLNKGRGAWWIVSSGLVLVQVLFGTLWVTIRDNQIEMRSDINKVAMEQAKREPRLDNIERNMGLILSGKLK